MPLAKLPENLKRTLVVKHVIEICDLPVLISNDGEGQLAPSHFIDILDPPSVRLDSVGRETNELNVPLCKFGLELSEGTELGGADRGII